MNPAVWEISGHMVLKRKVDYEGASEEYAWRILAEVSLSEERFQEVQAYIFNAAGLVESGKQENDANEKKTPIPTSQPLPTPYPEKCLVLQ